MKKWKMELLKKKEKLRETKEDRNCIKISINYSINITRKGMKIK